MLEPQVAETFSTQFSGKPLEEIVQAIAEHRLRNALAVRDYKTVSEISKRIFGLSEAYTKAKQKAIDILLGFGKEVLR